MRYKVTNASSLGDFLRQALHGIKNSTLKNYLQHGSIFVNAKPQKSPKFELKPGDVVEVNKESARIDHLRTQMRLNVLYEDEYLVAINKPAGLLSISDGKTMKTTAYELVYDYLQNSSRQGQGLWPLFIVHRLDRDVSGVLLFAKDEGVKDALQENWQTYQKMYQALVSPAPSRSEGVIENYLKETKTLRVYSQNKPGTFAKLARSLWRVVSRKDDLALLEIIIETGRKHQIRVHLAESGYPIIGDEDYGSAFKSREGIMLYASKLDIIHPVSNQPLSIKAPMPFAMKKYWQQGNSQQRSRRS